MDWTTFIFSMPPIPFPLVYYLYTTFCRTFTAFYDLVGYGYRLIVAVPVVSQLSLRLLVHILR